MLQKISLMRPFPSFPISKPETGHEGSAIQSMPGHKMVYRDSMGMPGVEVETPDGMLISFASTDAIERFIRENNLTVSDGAALRAIDARADPFRLPHSWFPFEQSIGLSGQA